MWINSCISFFIFSFFLSVVGSFFSLVDVRYVSLGSVNEGDILVLITNMAEGLSR